MAAVSLGVDTDHVGDIRTFDIASVEQVLPQIVKFVGKDPALDSDGIVSGLADESVRHFGEPPNAYVVADLPFLYHSLRTEKIERLIST